MHLFCFRHFEILEFNSLELTYMNRINDDCSYSKLHNTVNVVNF